jgi:hypothetical protein
MATDEQVAKAKTLADKVQAYLTSLGWPEPIVIFSGNGFHLLFRGDMCDASSEYWEHVLKHLAKKFNTTGAKIDISVGNPARISRLPGCYNRKGKGPGRLAHVVQYPDQWVELNHGKVYNLAVHSGMEFSVASAGRPRAGESLPELLADEDDVLQIINEFSEVLQLSHVDQREDATYFILSECPFAGHRHRGDRNKTALILSPNSLGFKCWSDDCADYHWHELKCLLYQRTGRLPSVRIYEEIEVTDEDVHRWGFTWEDMTPTDEGTVSAHEPSEEDWKHVEDHMAARGIHRLKESPQWQFDDQTWRVIHATEWSTMPRDASSYGLDAEDLHSALYDAALYQIEGIESEEKREAARQQFGDILLRRDSQEMLQHLDARDLFWAMRWKHRPNDPEDDRPITFEEMQRMAEAH